VVFWDRGLRLRNIAYLYLSAVLICGAALSKYVGVALIPLLLVYTFAFMRGLDRRLTARFMYAQALVVPVLALAFYQWATATMYHGHGLLFQAVGYAASTRDVPKTFNTRILEIVASLSFLGGAVASGFFFLPLLWGRRVLLGGLASFAVLTWAAPLLGPSLATLPGGWLAIVQLGVFVATGVALLALTGVDLWTRRDAHALLLALWVGGIFVFATFLNWTINVRSVLPLVPAAGILIARRLDQRFGPARQIRGYWLALPLVPAGALALLVTWADYQMAGSAREAAALIVEQARNHRATLLYQGHWGFQYYMSQAGVEPLDFYRYQRKPGDLVVYPGNNTNLDSRVPPGPWVRSPYFELEMLPCSWLATMDESVGAGFYAAVFGPLPYAFGKGQPARYQVMELAPVPAAKSPR
jgi:hypothetical protein